MSVVQPILLAAGLAAVLLTSAILVRLLRIERTSAALLALVVFGCAQVVLAAEVLSLAHALSGPALLTLHLGVAAALLAAGLRPEPPRLADRVASLRSAFAGPRSLRVLGLFTIGAGLLLLYLVVAVPPNNGDSLTYHLPRALTYLQQRSFDAYTTPDIRETVFPANSEILILWQLALWRAEWTAGLVHLLAWATSAMAVFGIGRQLGEAPAAAAFAGLAFLSLPAVVLQATTTQNDLLTACFLLCAVFFVAEACAGPRPAASLILAGLSLGLAVGTKPTALFALPGFAPWALAWLRGAWTERLKRLLVVGAAGAAGIALVGGYFYVQNLRRYGHPAGPDAFRDIVALDRFEPSTAWSNLGRLVVRMGDPTGVAPPGRVATALAEGHHAAARAVFAALGIQPFIRGRDLNSPDARWPATPTVFLHEDMTAFGPVLALLGLPALLVAAARRGRHAALAGTAILYLLLLAALLRWQVWHTRILITFAAFVAPLLAALLARPSRAGRIGSALVALACASSLFVCGACNQKKALLGRDTIRGRDRLERMRLWVAGEGTLYRLIDAMAPAPSLVTVAPLGPGDPRYPLFGPRLDRQVRPLRLDLEPVPPPHVDGRAEVLLVGGETATRFIDGAPPPGHTLFFVTQDVRPHLDRLRQPGSGWRAVVDTDGLGHLFVSAAGAAITFPSLPDQLPANDQWWRDGFVGPLLQMVVRFDPARPRLEIAGHLVDPGGPTTLAVAVPFGPEVRRFELAPGPFRIGIPLGALRRHRPADYVGVQIACDRSFNPAAKGLSADTRDLSWRIETMELVPPRGERP